MSQDITKRLYRYDSLLKAIDVFAQKFNLEQIADFAYEFSKEILTLNAVALFVLKDDYFVLRCKQLYDLGSFSIKKTKSIENIALFHGDIIKTNFEAYFSAADVERLHMKLVIPLLIHDTIYGFVVTDGKAMGPPLTDDDYTISSALLRIFSISLENSKHFSTLREINEQLDSKVFNLLAINRYTKAILGETSLENLYALSIDVFSEVSSARVTSFGIYDSLMRNIKLVGYRNAMRHIQEYAEFTLHITRYAGDRVVLSMESDLEIIQSLFVNWEDFKLLETKFIVLIVGDGLLGFVTLSDAVNQRVYTPEFFELVESLASSTYIAIKNAVLFQEIKKERDAAERKFQTLHTLNRLVNNINHCVTKEEVCRLAIKTINLSLGVRKAFICLREDGRYGIKVSVGLSEEADRFEFADPIPDVEEDTVFEFTEGGVLNYLPDEAWLNVVGSTNCMTISPLAVVHTWDEVLNPEESAHPMGYLVVLEVEDGLTEEHLLALDTISKNISPILYQMSLYNN